VWFEDDVDIAGPVLVEVCQHRVRYRRARYPTRPQVVARHCVCHAWKLTQFLRHLSRDLGHVEPARRDCLPVQVNVGLEEPLHELLCDAEFRFSAVIASLLSTASKLKCSPPIPSVLR